MAKNKKSRSKYLPKPKPEATSSVTFPALMLGDFVVPKFDGLAAVFGARLKEYPPQSSIPKVDRKYSEVVSSLFFGGGTLAGFGLKLKEGIDRAAAMTAIRAWLSSFEPQHEHKTATVAWALSEWCDPV